MARTTIIYTPHPDDETLRATGYVRYCKERGDNLILVAVTDGGASSIRTRLGLSVGQLKAVRRAEQAAAWSYLTDGDGIIRLGIEDGSVPANKAKIIAQVKALEKQYAAGGVEHYAACRLDDYHADHRAVAEALRDSGAGVVRYLAEPGNGGGTKYTPTPGYLWGAQRAADAYHEVGHISVPELFANLKASGYASHVARS